MENKESKALKEYIKKQDETIASFTLKVKKLTQQLEEAKKVLKKK